MFLLCFHYKLMLCFVRGELEVITLSSFDYTYFRQFYQKCEKQNIKFTYKSTIISVVRRPSKLNHRCQRA